MIIAQAIRPASSDLYPPTEAQIYRIEADPAEGFSWPYYLYVPDQAEARADRKEAVYLLILPNNTGEPSDDLAVHRQAAREAIDQYWDIPARLGTPLLIPVFPRPWEVERERDLYVHALDRATLQTTEAELGRVDVQLTAMMDDAADRLRQQGWEVNDRALIMGFSASGMFANRFTILHPDRILAAAIGSPGGWPVAPVASWDGNTLNYPLGVNDLMTLTGQPFDLASYQDVRQLFYLGIEDDNDAVDAENRPYLSQLFGSTPVERWPYAEEIYHTTGADVEFRMDDGVGHTISSELWRYQITFFKEAMAADARSRRP
jgi:pimeloyl-ACP methyl ester carboxylesterase